MAKKKWICISLKFNWSTLSFCVNFVNSLERTFTISSLVSAFQFTSLIGLTFVQFVSRNYDGVSFIFNEISGTGGFTFPFRLFSIPYSQTSTAKSKWLRVRELKMRPFEKSTNVAQTNLSRIAGSERQHRTSLSAMRPPSRLTVQSVFFRVYEHSGARLEFSFVVPYFLRWVRILLLVKLATERKPILPPRQQVASSFITMTPIIPVPR